MNINPIQPPPAAQPVEPTQATNAAGPASEATQISDTVEISTVARLTAQVHELPTVRADLVNRVKAEIAEEAYETPERLDAAIDRLMDELIS